MNADAQDMLGAICGWIDMANARVVAGTPKGEMPSCGWQVLEYLPDGVTVMRRVDGKRFEIRVAPV